MYLVSALCAGGLGQAVASPVAELDYAPIALTGEAPLVLVSQDVREESSLSLLRQKAALLDAYFASQAIQDIETQGVGVAADIVAEARRVLANARVAMEAGETDQVAPQLDEALRLLTRAASTAAHQAPARDDGEAAAQYEKLRRSVQNYLRSLSDDSSSTAGSEQVRETVEGARGLLADAENLAGAGRHSEANAVLGDAYRMAVRAIAESSRGKVVVSSLTFESLADEYAYERRRHESYRMLVDIMLNERSGDMADLRRLAERFVAESRDLAAGAEEKAKNGDHAAAIVTMEAATRRLVRLLQAGGLPVME